MIIDHLSTIQYVIHAPYIYGIAGYIDIGLKTLKTISSIKNLSYILLVST